MINEKIWVFQDCDGIDNTKEVFSLLISEFERIFGYNTMNNEKCLTFNDAQAGCPMLIIKSTPIQIRLTLKTLSYWDQTIFQLSHEFCHYAIRQHKVQKECTLSWLEEIICEAISLYALQYCAENWNQCSLSAINPNYSQAIFLYLTTELKQKWTRGFRDCKTLELLSQYENEKKAETDRASHRNERNFLYGEIVKNPAGCLSFCQYQNYINSDGVTINFTAWENDDSSSLIKALHKIQPYIYKKGTYYS